MALTATQIALNPDKDAAPEFEVWENATQSNLVIRKRGEYGVEQEERVTGRKRLEITARDRRMNEDRIANPRNNPFRNGTLVPLVLTAESHDAEELVNNPNLMTEEEMKALVGAPDKRFNERLKTIDNATVLQRLLAVAGEQDVRLSRYAAIEAHLDDVKEIVTVQNKKFTVEQGVRKEV